MDSTNFIVRYFKSIWFPKKIFKVRREFNWFQIILIFIFLNALMLVPVFVHNGELNTITIDMFYQQAFESVDGDVVEALQTTTVTGGQMTFTESFYLEKENGIIAGGLSSDAEQLALESENAIIFYSDRFSVKESGAQPYDIPYLEDFSVENVSTVEQLTQILSNQWFTQNRTNLMISMVIFALFTNFTGIIMTLLVPTLLAYFTKKTSFTSIYTFKESLALILLCLSVPTMIATLVGFFVFDLMVMNTIQSALLILVILIVFFRTRLKDGNF